MTIRCFLCDTNPTQDCKRCGFNLPVCADCVADDEWLRCVVCQEASKPKRHRINAVAVHHGCRVTAAPVPFPSWEETSREMTA